MTKLDIEKWDYCEQTLFLKGDLEKGFLVLAERLKKIRDEMLYNSTYDTFDEFVMELRMSKSTVYKIISVYEKFILIGEIPKEELAKQGWGNLSYFTRFVIDKASAISIFDKIAPLGRSDAIKVLKEMETGVAMAECAHDFEDVHIKECRICHEREKIYHE